MLTWYIINVYFIATLKQSILICVGQYDDCVMMVSDLYHIEFQFSNPFSFFFFFVIHDVRECHDYILWYKTCMYNN